MMGAVIQQIWRYPVSSIGGESIAEAHVSPEGMEGDRQFALVDLATREVAYPERDQRWQKAIFLQARTTAKGVELRVPGHDWQRHGTAKLKQALSEFMDFETDIWPQALGQSKHDNTVPRRYAVAPLHLITTTSLAHLASLLPTSNIDVRRFRANLIVESPDLEPGFPEFQWIGSQLQLGTIPAQVPAPAKRCKFTALAQDQIAEDHEILRTIVTRGNRNFGIYAAPTMSGLIRKGDPVNHPKKPA